MKEIFKKQYELRFSKIQAYRNKVWKVLTKSFFQQYIPVDADMLEIGSGWGEFINNIKGRRRIAMDLNMDARQHLDPSVEFIHQDCSKEWPLPDNSLDIVFTSNFFEHLPSKSHIEKNHYPDKEVFEAWLAVDMSWAKHKIPSWFLLGLLGSSYRNNRTFIIRTS
jgi:ubiquinone/menaquinone biosynthesis C-methylase UbiE